MPRFLLASRFAVLFLLLASLAPGAALAADAAVKDRPTRKPRPAATEPATGQADDNGADKAPVPTAPIVGWLEISGHLRDGPPPFTLLPGMEGKHSLKKIVDELAALAKDKKHKGLVVYLDQTELTMAQVFEVGQAIKKVRDAGKKVLVFSEAYDLKSYLLACSADQILLQRKGMIELEGLGVEEMYFLGLFDKIGLKADFLQVGKYKGAEEPFTRAGPSKEWSETFDGLLDSLYDQVLTRIADTRHLTKEKVQQALAESFTMSDEEYVKRGLVDRLVERDLTEVTGEVFGDRFEWDEDLSLASGGGGGVQANNPLALFQLLFQDTRPQITRNSIAVVHCYGPITSGESGNEGPPLAGLFSSASIGSRTIVRALGDAKDNDLIKGIVIRIDSPGGSALASEVIWQAVRECAAKKPVFVSVGAMAASGGYYIACGGHEIYVAPSSIVGSIGVVGGKFVMGGLYQWAGVSVNRRSRGPLGDMFNSVEPFTPDQRKALQATFDRTYEQFTDRVTKGRGKRIKELDKVAQGRIFSGQQALANGLADKIGGLDQALADLAKQLGLQPGKYDIVNLPEPRTLPEYLSDLLGVRANVPQVAMTSEQAAVVQAARTLLGPKVWRQVQGHVAGLSLLRDEHVLTLTPAAIVVK